MKLYYKPGACSLASHIILERMGVNYQIEQVDTDKKLTENGDNFLEINPKGYVPAMEIEKGQYLTENPAVLTYLGTLKPESGLIPEDSIEYSRMLENLSYISSELHKSFAPFFSGRMLTEEEEKDAHQQLDDKMKIFDQLLSDGRPYLHGSNSYVSDYFLFVVANWANFVGFGLKKWSYVNDFVERVSVLPYVKEAMKQEGLAA